MPIDPNSETSDIGQMYRQYLQSKGMPLTNDNMQRVISQSQREPGMISGLSVQQAPQMNAPPPPNIAGASRGSSIAPPPLPPPGPPALPQQALPIPPMPPQVQSSTAQGPSMVPQQAPPQPTQPQPAPQILKPDVAPQTPPPGQAPGAAQIAHAISNGGEIPGAAGSGQPTGAAAIDARRQAMVGVQPQSVQIPVNSVSDPNSADPLAAMRAHREQMAAGKPQGEPPTATSSIGNLLAPALAALGIGMGARALSGSRSQPTQPPSPTSVASAVNKGTPIEGAKSATPNEVKPPNAPSTGPVVGESIPSSPVSPVSAAIEKSIPSEPSHLPSTVSDVPAYQRRGMTITPQGPVTKPLMSARAPMPDIGIPERGTPVPDFLRRQTNEQQFVKGVNPIGPPQRPQMQGVPNVVEGVRPIGKEIQGPPMGPHAMQGTPGPMQGPPEPLGNEVTPTSIIENILHPKLSGEVPRVGNTVPARAISGNLHMRPPRF